MQNPDETKEMFYSRLTLLIPETNPRDKLLVLGDFNARVGCDHGLWSPAIGKHGIGKVNTNGEMLLALCMEQKLTIMNTMFKQKDAHKCTWYHPRSRHGHMIDFAITRQEDKTDVTSCRVMRGASCWTDHHLVRCCIRLKLHVTRSRQNAKPKQRLNVAPMQVPQIQSEVEAALESTFDRTQLNNISDTNGKWESFSKSVYEICKDHLNTTSRKRPDWFEENDLTITSLINEKNQLHQKILNERASRKTTRAYKESCRKVQREIRRLKNLWWQNKAHELQDAADRHDMRAFYAGLKEVWGPSPRSGTNIKSRDGTVLQDPIAVMERWVDHFSSLLNMPGDIAETSLQRIKQEPMAEWMSSAPTIDATQKAIHVMKDHKAPGGDGENNTITT